MVHKRIIQLQQYYKNKVPVFRVLYGNYIKNNMYKLSEK